MLNISENANLDIVNVESDVLAFGNMITMNHPILQDPGVFSKVKRKWYNNQTWNTPGGTQTGSVGVGPHDVLYVYGDPGSEPGATS